MVGMHSGATGTCDLASLQKKPVENTNCFQRAAESVSDLNITAIMRSFVIKRKEGQGTKTRAGSGL